MSANGQKGAFARQRADGKRQSDAKSSAKSSEAKQAEKRPESRAENRPINGTDARARAQSDDAELNQQLGTSDEQLSGDAAGDADRELKAHIYQHLLDINPYLAADSQVA